MMKCLLTLPLFGLLMTGCMTDLINSSTDAIHQNRYAVEQSTCTIRENQQLIEQSTQAIAENKRALDAMQEQ